METTIHIKHKKCQREIHWFDENFWNDLPIPGHKYLANQQNCYEVPKAIQLVSKLTMTSQIEQSKLNAKPIPDSTERKYFTKWRNYVRKSIEVKSDICKQKLLQEKLAFFLNSLHEQKQKLKEVKKSIYNKSKIRHSQNTSYYEHRFETQQNIIEYQKLKLVKQNKLIEQLKLGVIDQEINESIQETEKNLKEAFLKCSVKLKCPLAPYKMLMPNEEISLFPISNKAPKIVQEMENRAIEREKRRQITLERKRILEQERKALMLMEIERKKAQDEQVRKESLKAIKERRKRELEHQKIIQIRKREFYEKSAKAESFYRTRLKMFGLNAFIRIVIIKQNNQLKSEIFNERRLKRNFLNYWIILINAMYEKKYNLAAQLYNERTLQKIFKSWFEMYVLSIQNLQVADDVYEMKLQSKVFTRWHIYVCKQYVRLTRNLQKAQKHYNSHILLHYFYQWKSLPLVLKIERAKEEKKQKWRKKVREVLPDYNPVIEDL